MTDVTRLLANQRRVLGSRDPAPPITDEDAGDDGVCNARWLQLTTANKYGRHLAAAGAEINYVQVQTWIISILET